MSEPERIIRFPRLPQNLSVSDAEVCVDGQPEVEPAAVNESGVSDKEKCGKNTTVVEIPQSQEGGEPPPVSVPPTPAPPTGNESQVHDPDPLTPEQVRSSFSRLIDKVQLAALQKVEATIVALEKDNVPLAVLIDLIMKLADLKLTAEWTKKLETAILKNPSLLAQGKSSPLLQRLQGGAAKVAKAKAGDGRGSNARHRKAVGAVAPASILDFPDEA